MSPIIQNKCQFWSLTDHYPSISHLLQTAKKSREGSVGLELAHHCLTMWITLVCTNYASIHFSFRNVGEDGKQGIPPWQLLLSTMSTFTLASTPPDVPRQVEAAEGRTTHNNGRNGTNGMASNHVFDIFDTIPLIPLQPLQWTRPPQLRCHQQPVPKTCFLRRDGSWVFHLQP